MLIERMKLVDITKNTPETIEYMLNEIVTKLKMVNVSAINSEQIDPNSFTDLKDIYEMVMKKSTFSPNEMQAIVEELGRLRK